MELVNAEQFVQKLGIAQIKHVDITDQHLNSRILSSEEHLGSGLTRGFVEGKNLMDRPLVARISLRSEILEIDEDGTLGALVH